MKKEGPPRRETLEKAGNSSLVAQRFLEATDETFVACAHAIAFRCPARAQRRQCATKITRVCGLDAKALRVPRWLGGLNRKQRVVSVRERAGNRKKTQNLPCNGSRKATGHTSGGVPLYQKSRLFGRRARFHTGLSRTQRVNVAFRCARVRRSGPSSDFDGGGGIHVGTARRRRSTSRSDWFAAARRNRSRRSGAATCFTFGARGKSFPKFAEVIHFANSLRLYKWRIQCNSTLSNGYIRFSFSSPCPLPLRRSESSRRSPALMQET